MEYAHVLVVEDEGIVARDLVQHLQHMGHSVLATASSGREAVQIAAETRPDLVLMDIRLHGDMDGIDTASELRARYDLPIVYLTAYADQATLQRAKVTEPFGYVLKPFEERELQVTIELALHKHRMERQLRDYAQEIDRLNAELERRVLERTDQLQATVSELEAFSYTLAHDLRAPLRAIAGFSGLLLRGYAADLPPQAQRYLQLVQRNGEQMGRLLDELLAFARLNHEQIKKETMAPAGLVHSVLADLQVEQADRQVAIVVGELPPCQANPTLLRQVFTNLLSNALKFTRSRTLARIEIGAQQQSDQCSYFVKDNGVGFDMQYASKLFGVFERLHHVTEYEGNGIGLAVVQRIVQHHGGRVWAEATVDQGATFYFTLAHDPSVS